MPKKLTTREDIETIVVLRHEMRSNLFIAKYLTNQKLGFYLTPDQYLVAKEINFERKGHQSSLSVAEKIIDLIPERVLVDINDLKDCIVSAQRVWKIQKTDAYRDFKDVFVEKYNKERADFHVSSRIGA